MLITRFAHLPKARRLERLDECSLDAAGHSGRLLRPQYNDVPPACKARVPRASYARGPPWQDGRPPLVSTQRDAPFTKSNGSRTRPHNRGIFPFRLRPLVKAFSIHACRPGGVFSCRCRRPRLPRGAVWRCRFPPSRGRAGRPARAARFSRPTWESCGCRVWR